MNVCTGDMGTVAAKKYDLEAWMPAQQRFREMVSCSNVDRLSGAQAHDTLQGEARRTTRGWSTP